MMMSRLLIAQRCSQKRYNAIFYAMEMRSSVARISVIIRKLQFRLKSNQEPGKISHVRRYRMNLYHSNYAFAWWFFFCEIANWGSMWIASDCIFRLTCGNGISFILWLRFILWTRVKNCLRIWHLIVTYKLHPKLKLVRNCSVSTFSLSSFIDFSLQPSTTFPHH